MIIDELEGRGKKPLWPILSYCSRICPRRITKYISRDNLAPGPGSNPSPSKYKARIL